MSDLETLFRAVDALDSNELKQLNDYIQHRRRLTWWVVLPQNLQQIDQALNAVHGDADHLAETDINIAIDEALNEVRHERNQGDH